MLRSGPVLVVEGGAAGHWLKYVSYLVRQADAQGVEVHVALRPEAIRSAEYAISLRDLLDDERVHVLDPFSLASAEATADQVGAGHVVLPSGDEFLLAMVRPGRFAGASVNLLLMRLHRQRDAGLRGALRTAVKRACVALLTTRSRFQVFGLRSALAGSGGTGLLRTVPDPATLESSPSGTASLLDRWRPDPTVHWFGVFGAISARKNLPSIIDALRLDTERRFGVIVAGRFEADVAARVPNWLEDPSLTGRVVIDDRVLDDDEFDSAFSAVDGVVIAHTNEGPSGVLGKAALSGTPVLAAGAQSLRKEALDHPDLARWVPLDARRLLAGMRDVSALHGFPQQVSAPVERFAEPLLRAAPRGRAAL